MWSKICTYIEKYKLLDSSDLYLVALSGGADSVTLLLLLREMGYRVEAAHCNFHLRGEESNRDEAFCVELCERLGVELHRAHFDTQTYAMLHKVSIEMAARELRYRWFAQLGEDIGAAGVCVAHHRDDSVETVLLNLVRGTGLRGLTGIQPLASLGNTSPGDTPPGSASRLKLIRPLLCVSRAEIEAFLASKGQRYVTDSTNLEADVQRNKLRLRVLPLLRELNPAVSEHIARTAEHLSGAQQLLDAVVDKYKDCKTLDLNGLSAYGSSEYIIFEWLRNYGFNGSQARQVVEASTGAVFTSPTGYDLLKDRDRLVVEPSLKPLVPLRMPEGGTYVFGEGQRVTVRKEPVWVSREPAVATLDAEKVRFPLTLRRVEEGDWMIPYGMTGRKLLSDLMTDRKMSVFEKRRQLVVTDQGGAVLWLVGVRVDQRVAVTPDTVQVFSLRLWP